MNELEQCRAEIRRLRRVVNIREENERIIKAIYSLFEKTRKSGRDELNSKVTYALIICEDEYELYERLKSIYEEYQ